MLDTCTYGRGGFSHAFNAFNAAERELCAPATSTHWYDHTSHAHTLLT